MKIENTISIWDASSLVCSYGKCVDREELPIMDCLGRVLALNVISQIPQPPFPRSAMDGYAIKAKESQGACKENPVTLKVVGCQYAGDPYFRALQSGEALRIMTGAAIPRGADSVIRQEDTDYGEEEVKLYTSVESGANYCPIGEDFPQGDLLAARGDVVDAYLIAAAVAAGIDKLTVYQRIKASVITTGDELQEAGSVLQEGKIYNSNLALFSSRFVQLGCQLTQAKAAGDSLQLIEQSIEEAAKNCDIIITTGGVSVGQRDLIPEVMEKMGAEIVFHGIAIKPGMPTMFSVYKGIPVISLSGNPYSAAAVFELLVQPLLKTMTASKQNVLKKVRGIARDSFGKKSFCTRFLRGFYEDGNLYFAKGQSNGQSKAGIGCNCLICLEAGQGKVEEGSTLDAYLL